MFLSSVVNGDPDQFFRRILEKTWNWADTLCPWIHRRNGLATGGSSQANLNRGRVVGYDELSATGAAATDDHRGRGPLTAPLC